MEPSQKADIDADRALKVRLAIGGDDISNLNPVPVEFFENEVEVYDFDAAIL